ncbi:MAG TPA: phosphatidylglycerophosphatase A [Casimicrobiaceae bacterium]|nr:phosphatidylglycerophosphatase A [Casimicrobiaceae bacterium]
MQSPTFAFLIRHPAHFIALGFGAGLAPVMPGTFGTLVAFPIAWWLQAHAGVAGWMVAIGAFTAIGVWSAQVTGTDLGRPDHGSIVVDEIAAFLLVLFFAGGDAMRQFAAFALFRFFDIVKPPPIRQLDAAIKNGFGVMLDDFVAAGYALIVLAIVVRIAGSA